MTVDIQHHLDRNVLLNIRGAVYNCITSREPDIEAVTTEVLSEFPSGATGTEEVFERIARLVDYLSTADETPGRNAKLDDAWNVIAAADPKLEKRLEGY